MIKLDHVNIHVTDGPGMVAFFDKVLGAKEGFRPPFDFPGHWLYFDGAPAVHLTLVEREGGFPQGMVNHVAFGVYDFDETKARIEAAGCPYQITGIPESEIGQFFVTGPEGLLVEIQFRRKIAGPSQG